MKTGHQIPRNLGAKIRALTQTLNLGLLLQFQKCQRFVHTEFYMVFIQFFVVFQIYTESETQQIVNIGDIVAMLPSFNKKYYQNSDPKILNFPHKL